MGDGGVKRMANILGGKRAVQAISIGLAESMSSSGPNNALPIEGRDSLGARKQTDGDKCRVGENVADIC